MPFNGHPWYPMFLPVFYTLNISIFGFINLPFSLFIIKFCPFKLVVVISCRHQLPNHLFSTFSFSFRLINCGLQFLRLYSLILKIISLVIIAIYLSAYFLRFIIIFAISLKTFIIINHPRL